MLGRNLLSRIRVEEFGEEGILGSAMLVARANYLFVIIILAGMVNPGLQLVE